MEHSQQSITPVKNYNAVARWIHWLSAITVFSLFGVGLWMVDLNYYSEWYKTAPDYHRSVGIILAIVTIGRIIWKHLSKSPNIIGKPVEVLAAKVAHGLMYVLLITLFVSGYLISTSDGRGIEVFNWFTVPGLGELFPGQSDIAGEIHFYTAWTLVIFAGIHAAAALKHHFLDKDDTLRKMLGASK